MQCACELDSNDRVTSACSVHAEYARQVARGLALRCPPDQPYAALILTLHDRDEHTTKSALCYPVARVELLDVFNDRLPETARRFTVNDGRWVEQQ